MANREHLEILKQRAKAWNQWRDENRAIAPDLKEADLIGADLRLADLRLADLRDANFNNANP